MLVKVLFFCLETKEKIPKEKLQKALTFGILKQASLQLLSPKQTFQGCTSGTASRRRDSNSLHSNRSPLTYVWQHLRLRTYSEAGRPCGI